MISPFQQTASTPTTPPLQHGPDRFEYWVKVFIGLCILIIAFDLSFIVISSWIYPKKSTISTAPQPTTPATISGNVDINGFIPANATIEILSRQIGENEYTIATTLQGNLDGAGWSWSTAQNGSTYELKAVVKSDGKVIAESLNLAVTAPATNETLRIISTVTMPQSTTPTASTQREQSTNSMSVSGKIDLNGYIPPNATITVLIKKQGETNFSPIVSGINATDGIAWNWNGAESGISYELQALLYAGSSVIGTSPTLSTAAPAQNETLVINSKANAPITQGSISGSYNVNGSVPNGATITLSMRKSGTPQFTPVLSGMPVQDGSSWNIPNVQIGLSYDILAYVFVNNSSYSESQLLVVSAPANNEVLHLNIAPRPNAPPSSSITFTCAGKNSNNQWQINVQYNQNMVNPNAKAFLVQLGTNSGGSDIFTIQTAPSNPSQMQTYSSNYLLNEGQTYFLSYAYSTCQNCTNSSFYSQFSQPIQVRCTTNPTSTPSMTPTNSPTSSPTPPPTSTVSPTLSPTASPTNSPSPTPTPKISECNESCGGSSGYTCNEGLTCIDGNPGTLGGEVCRNPACTTETSCTCP